MTEIEIRPVALDERRHAVDTFRAALLTGAINDENFDESVESWDESDALAAWIGDRCVGVVAAFKLDSTVPGGARVPTAGVTRVGVLPTHTRRGVLTQLMHRLLRDSRERSNPIATLHASETPIYRRFGFGLGTDDVSVTVTPNRARPWRTPGPAGTMRLLHHTEVAGVVPELYDRIARWRVGSISRPAWMWRRLLKDASGPTCEPFGAAKVVAVHTGADGVDDGYVQYTVKWDEPFGGNPTGVGEVEDLRGASPEVERELWRYLVDIDLVTSWTAETRPVDEPVRRAMHDGRAYEVRRVIDDQWVRLLDVEAALGARTFTSADASIAIKVIDPMFADNTGTWAITPDGASRSDVAADLSVDIAALSAAYLGAVSWHDLAASGEIERAPSDLLDRLDGLFAVRPTPYCGTGY